MVRRLIVFVFLLCSCGDDDSVADAGRDVGRDAEMDALSDAGTDVPADAEMDALSDAGTDALAPCSGEEVSLRVVTFNTGTTEGRGRDDHPDGYGEQQELWSDMYYGNGLSWTPAIDASRHFFDAVEADVVVFQELFYSEECADVPLEARAGFVCEGWESGATDVAHRILGDDFRVACHLGKTDKCIAVRADLGVFEECEQSLCMDALAGARVPECGSGSRVGRGRLALTDGPPITLVNVHGSSGLLMGDQTCREQQFEQVFVDLGDGSGEPAVADAFNLVMGDFNTDPARALDFDTSAQRLAEFVGEGQAFQFISEVGEDAPGSYLGVFDIDHVISDSFEGRCWIGGLSEGHETPVYAPPYFDHRPVVCDVRACLD